MVTTGLYQTSELGHWLMVTTRLYQTSELGQWFWLMVTTGLYQTSELGHQLMVTTGLYQTSELGHQLMVTTVDKDDFKIDKANFTGPKKHKMASRLASQYSIKVGGLNFEKLS